MGLYTKIKGDMEFTNVGTPTITDGIVSGFTSSSYIKTNMPFYSNNKTWEFIFKIKFNTLSGRTTIVGDINVNDSCIQLGTNGTHLITYMSSKGTSTWDIGSAITGTYTLLTDTYYYIKYEFTGTQYKASISTDKITWTADITINSSLIVFQGKHLSLGYNNGSYPEPLQGEIDLNETTLKIGNNIWFGTEFSKVKIKTGSDDFIIKGSPIIENNIITNLSPSNYITTKSFFTNISSFEINIKCKLPDNFESKNPMVIAHGNKILLGLNSARKMYMLFNNGNQGATGTTVLTAGGIYHLKYTLNEDRVIKMYFSTDGLNYTLEATNTLTESNYNIILASNSKFEIGTWSYGNAYRAVDSLYLIGSYININNKLVWTGLHSNINTWKIQQDNFSKYYTIVDGKLTWASPDIYLESSSDNYGGDGINAKQWINTNYIPSQDIEYEIDFTLFTSETSANNSYIMGTNCFGLEGHWNNNSNNALIYFNANYTFTMTRNERHKVAVKKQNDNYNFYLDNVLQTTFTELTIAPTRKMYLFALNAYDSGRAAYASYSRIYKYKIWDNGTLLYHFVPVPKGLLIGNFVVPSNGMFDIVEQKFYGNEGTGDFAIGGIPEDYIIEGGKLIWCNSDIYLESSGTQYINTNILTSYDLSIDIEYYRESGYLFGYLGNMDGINKSFGYTSSGTNGYLRIGNWYVYNNTSWADNTWLKLHAERDKTKASINGTLFTSSSTGTPTDFNNGNNITLFQYNNAGGSNLVGKIKNFQVKQNLTILQYLVPVPKGILIGDKIAPSNCMFDIVTQTFFENQGTGDFIIGGLSGDYINVGDNIIWTDNNVYISNNGSNRWIDTGFTADKNNYSYIADIKFSGNSRQLMGFGGTSIEYWGIKNNTQFELSGSYINVTSSNERIEAIFKWIYDDSTSPYYSMQCELTIGNNTVKKDNTQSSSSTAVVTNKRPYYLFKMWNYTSLYCNAKMYSHKVYNENNKLMQYLLPVNTDTVVGNFTVPAPGMWDAVTKKFYPNKGTGNFTYGKDE